MTKRKVDVSGAPSASAVRKFWREQLESWKWEIEDILPGGDQEYPAGLLSLVWTEGAEPMIRELERLRPKTAEAPGVHTGRMIVGLVRSEIKDQHP